MSTAKLRLGAFNDAGCDAVVFVDRAILGFR